MSSCRNVRWPPGVLRCAPALVAVLTVALPSCSGDDEPSTSAEGNPIDGAADMPGACLWETDELLAHVETQARGAKDCGISLGGQPLDDECFTSALAAGDAVQITINNCIDCMIHSTYLSTSSGDKLHLYREADSYGDALRVARVEGCTDFRAGEGPGAACLDPSVLYACSDPLPGPSEL